MAKRHATRRRVSAGAALVTGLGTIGLGLFTAAPAQADVSNTLNYTCEVSDLGITFEDPWKVDLTVGVPEQVEPGEQIEAPEITAEVTPGQDANEQMRALNIKSLEGTSEASYTVGDTEGTADLTIPHTEVPAEGSVTTVASGTAAEGVTAPSEPGELPISAGDFTAALTTDTGFVLNLACTAPEDNTVGAIQVGDAGGDGDTGGDDGDTGGDTGGGDETPEVNDWFDEPSSLPLENNVFTVDGTASQAGTLIIQVLDSNHEELTSYTWDVEEGEVSNTFELVEGADYVRILSEGCVDAEGNTEEVPGTVCNVEYRAPWAADGDTGNGDDGDNGGDTGNGDDGNNGGDTGNGDDQGEDTGNGDDTGNSDDQGQDTGDGDDQGQDTGDDQGEDAGQPQVPDVVQTDGGQLKSADSTNSALALGGLLLFGAGAGAVFAARRRAEQH